MEYIDVKPGMVFKSNSMKDSFFTVLSIKDRFVYGELVTPEYGTMQDYYSKTMLFRLYTYQPKELDIALTSMSTPKCRHVFIKQWYFNVSYNVCKCGEKAP